MHDLEEIKERKQDLQKIRTFMPRQTFKDQEDHTDRMNRLKSLTFW